MEKLKVKLKSQQLQALQHFLVSCYENYDFNDIDISMYYNLISANKKMMLKCIVVRFSKSKFTFSLSIDEFKAIEKLTYGNIYFKFASPYDTVVYREFMESCYKELERLQMLMYSKQVAIV